MSQAGLKLEHLDIIKLFYSSQKQKCQSMIPSLTVTLISISYKAKS